MKRLILFFLPVALFAQVGGSIFSPTPGGGGGGTNQDIRAVSFTFDGAGSALTGPQTRCQQVNYAGTIQEATLLADASGSATVDVQTVAYGSYTGPGSASSITASDTPALSSAVAYQDSTLTGWTTAVSANTVFCFVLSSPSTVKWVSGNVKIAATANTANQNIRAVSFLFDGGGSALSGTVTRCQQVNYSGTIQEVTLLADASGSATVDVQTVAYASYTGPGSASSITASDTPALSSAVAYQDSTLTGWTTSLSANTMVCFVLSSPTTVKWVSGNIKIAAN